MRTDTETQNAHAYRHKKTNFVAVQHGTLMVLFLQLCFVILLYMLQSVLQCMMLSIMRYFLQYIFCSGFVALKRQYPPEYEICAFFYML